MVDYLKIVADSLSAATERKFSAVAPENHLIADFGLESIDMMNLFVEIERRIDQPIHLIEILRERNDPGGYSRDLKVADIVSYLQTHLSQA